MVKKLYELCTKITYVFTDFYVLKQGYIISLKIDEPFVIELNDNTIKLFQHVHGDDFSILNIENVREYKKCLQYIWFPKKVDESKGDKPITPEELNYRQEHYNELLSHYNVVTSKLVTNTVVGTLERRLRDIRSCDKWDAFILSNKEEENEKIIESIFKNNDYTKFQPIQTPNGPYIILTKSLLPLVSEKNYTDLYYTSKQLSENLFLIIFDFDFSLFRLFMLHHYIQMELEDSVG